MTAAPLRREMLAQRHRGMAAVIGLLVVLESAANPMLAAAFGFDLSSAAHYGSLFDRPAGAAELLRWGAILDLGGYLSLGVVVVYVGHRMWRVNELVVAVLTASGASAVVVGGTGAAVLATVGPALLSQATGAPGVTGEAARLALETVGSAVATGVWGTITFGLLGAWLLGVGLLLRSERLFAWVAVLGGTGMLASSIRTAATGRILPELAGPLDTLTVLIILGLLVCFFLWLVWLAIRLWRAPEGRIGKADLSRAT